MAEIGPEESLGTSPRRRWTDATRALGSRELPEGAEFMLTVSDADEMDDAERSRLHRALERSMAQAKVGQSTDADEVIGKLLARE
jgi:hypothetical protein